MTERLGIYESKDLSNEEYHNDEALGSSDIKSFLHTKELYRKKKYYNSSDSKRIGSAFHSLLLEGRDKFFQDFKVRRKPNGRKFRGNGSQIVSLTEYQMLSDWCRKIPRTQIYYSGKEFTLAQFLQNNKIKDISTELSYFWVNKLGVRCKARFDILINDTFIIDPKTMANPNGLDLDTCINQTIARYNYNIQAVHYLTALRRLRKTKGLEDKQCTFCWMFQETTAPYRVVIKQMPNDWVENTQEAILQSMNNYLEAKKQERFEDTFNNIIYTDEMPYWWRERFNFV